MNNSEPQPSNNVPTGYIAEAVSLVREGHGLSRFYMAQLLGITMNELIECETVSRWPHSQNARQRLIAMAHQKQVNIAQEE